MSTAFPTIQVSLAKSHVCACVQAALAVGLLQLRPWKPRTVGFLGIVASAINCYMLTPAVAKPAASIKPASKPEPLPAPLKAEPALKTA